MWLYMAEISTSWNQHWGNQRNSSAEPELKRLKSPTSNWPNQDHQVPYIVPRTAHCLSSPWSNNQHWTYAPGVCNGTEMSWRILHSWLIEYPLQDNSRDMHSGIPARSGYFVQIIKATLRHIYLCRTANMSWRTCVVVKQIQSNPIWQFFPFP